MTTTEITNDVELTILRKYAAGAELATIGKDLRIRQESVVEAVSQLAGFQRGRARELVRQHEVAHQPKPTPPAAARPVTPPALTPAAPASAGEPEVVITPHTDGSRSPVETILARAKAAGGRYAKRAEKIREQVTELDADLAGHQHVIDAEKKVEVLRRQLDEAAAKLRELKSGAGRPAPATPATGPTPREVRAWAKAAGVECGSIGRVPAPVMDAYHAAHAEAA